jgi:hypothetical protein
MHPRMHRSAHSALSRPVREYRCHDLAGWRSPLLCHCRSVCSLYGSAAAEEDPLARRDGPAGWHLRPAAPMRSRPLRRASLRSAHDGSPSARRRGEPEGVRSSPAAGSGPRPRTRGCSPGHPADEGFVRVLDNRDAAAPLAASQARGPIVVGAGEDHPHDPRPVRPRGGAEQGSNAGRWRFSFGIG